MLSKRWRAPTPSTPMFGPAWVRKKKLPSAAPSSRPSRSIANSSRTQPNMRCSCTACRRIAGTRLRRKSSTHRVLLSSIRRRTVCTFRNPFLFCCWKAVRTASRRGAPMREKVVLAYSGGLDTSIIIPWLKENYDYDVIAFVADVGQGDDIEAVVKKAYDTGACKVIVEDLRQEFLSDY